MYVAVEGLNGAGKSTLCAEVARALGPRIVPHKEPSTGPVGLFLREEILQKRINNWAVAALFTADRMTTLPPLLGSLQGRILLADRCFLSTFAYQADPRGREGLPPVDVWAMSESVPKPDLLVYLDIDPPAAARRVAEAGHPVDRNEGLLALEHARDRYEEAIETLMRAHEVPVLRLDASAPREENAGKVISEIEHRMALRKASVVGDPR